MTTDPLTVLFQGSAGSGKSQLICWRTLNRANPDTKPTLEDFHEGVFQNVRGNQIEVNFLDTAGRTKYADMVEEWVDRANAQILVLNLEDATSVAYLKLNQPVLNKPSIRARVLVGNLPSGKQENRVVSEVEAAGLAKSLFDHEMPYVETNTRNGDGVHAVFTTLIERFFPEQRSGADVVKTIDEEKDNKQLTKFDQLLAERDAEILNLKSRQAELESQLAAQEKAYTARFEALESKLADSSLAHRVEEMVVVQLKKLGLTRHPEAETPPKSKDTQTQKSSFKGRGPVKHELFSPTTTYP